VQLLGSRQTQAPHVRVVSLKKLKLSRNKKEHMGGTLTKKDDAGFGGETQQDEPATITAQLWENLPNELKIYVLSFLTPSQVIYTFFFLTHC